MTLDELTPIIRHILQTIAGMLVAGGWITEEMATALAGLGVSVATLVWWWRSKSRAALVAAQ